MTMDRETRAAFVAKDNCPLVMVTWLDSRQSDGAWRRLHTVSEAEPVRCVSVGWLLHDGPQCKTVAQSLGDIDDETDMQAAGIKVIPSRCVESVVRLEETAALGLAVVREAAE